MIVIISSRYDFSFTGDLAFISGNPVSHLLEGIWFTHVHLHHWHNSFCLEGLLCMIKNSVFYREAYAS